MKINKEDATELVKNLLLKLCENKDIDNNTKLIETGIVDSLIIVELVMEIETALETEIDLELITVENFETIETIVEMLLKSI